LTLLSDPRTPWFQSGIISHQDAAKAVGLSFRLVETTSGDAIETAFADLASGGADGVATATQPIMLRERARIGASALAHKIPTVVPFAEMVPYGSLMSYGGDFSDFPRKAAVYVDQILKGAKPADLPVEQPTRTRLVINLKTAHALGLSVPPTLLATADEVIE
jgi:putative ABC transport system substrate-binding protein